MFKEIKSQAKKLLFENYKTFLPLILLYEFFNVLNNIVFNFLFKEALTKQQLLLSIVLVIAIFIISLFALPFLTVSIYKVGFCALKSETDTSFVVKQFLTFKNLFKIAVINLIPTILTLLYATARQCSDYFNSRTTYLLLSIFITLVSHFASYKLFICNYHFALNESSIKETLNYSVNKMKSLFFKYICFNYSFILWDILIVVIAYAVSLWCTAINVNYDNINFLSSFGYGLMFFYRPYRFLSELFLCNKLENPKKKKRHSK